MLNKRHRVAIYGKVCNEDFMMLSKLVQEINRQELGIDRKVKEKLALIFDAQTCINNIYEEIKNCLAKKKGDLRHMAPYSSNAIC